MKWVTSKHIKTNEIAKEVIVDALLDSNNEKLKVMASNNALDDTPIWEDITSFCKNKKVYFFYNRNYKNEPAISIKLLVEDIKDLKAIAVGYNI